MDGGGIILFNSIGFCLFSAIFVAPVNFRGIFGVLGRPCGFHLPPAVLAPEPFSLDGQSLFSGDEGPSTVEFPSYEIGQKNPSPKPNFLWLQ